MSADSHLRTRVAAAVQESERGKLRPIRQKSEGGIRNELGNGALGMFQLSKLYL